MFGLKVDEQRAESRAGSLDGDEIPQHALEEDVCKGKDVTATSGRAFDIGEEEAAGEDRLEAYASGASKLSIQQAVAIGSSGTLACAVGAALRRGSLRRAASIVSGPSAASTPIPSPPAGPSVRQGVFMGRRRATPVRITASM